MNILKNFSIRYVLGFVSLVFVLLPNTLFAAVTVYETQSRRDYYSVVQPDMMANGGVNETAAHGYPQYQVNQASPTGQRICYLYDPTAYPTTWSLGGFDSPGNNRMAAWDPAQNKWVVRSAGSFGNKRYNYITCKTDAKADTSLTANGASQVTINPGESVNLSWYSQYGSTRKANCTATNFSTTVDVPAYTQTTPVPNCVAAGFDLLSLVGFDCSGFVFNQTSVPASQAAQPFSGTKTVSPTQTTTYTYSCTNENGTNTSSVTVNVVQPETEAVAVSCSPSPSSGVTNEPITWTAQVFNHDGPFTYSWQGSDGLTGTAASVIKSYSNTGTKTARVTVSYNPTAPETPSTPTTVTPSCLPGGSEVPAGYLCSAGGLQTIAWGQCCSGVARVQCPAPNEPAEAYCTGNANTGSGTVTSGSGIGEWVFVSTDTSDLACGATGSGFRRSAANNSNVRLNMQTCPSENPEGQSCTNVGTRCKWNAWAGNTCNLESAVYICASASAPTPPPPTPVAEGFSITTDCNGTVCTNRTCTVDGGGSGSTNPGNPNSTPNNPNAPTWGVTINLPGQCFVGAMCVGPSVYNQSLDCSKEFVKTCPYGCISGQCVAPQPEIDLSVSPAGVRRGETCSIHVGARNVSGCRVSGLGISQNLVPNASGVVESQNFATPPIQNSSTYTVSCDSPRGSVSESVQCVLLPNFREI